MVFLIKSRKPDALNRQRHAQIKTRDYAIGGLNRAELIWLIKREFEKIIMLSELNSEALVTEKGSNKEALQLPSKHVQLLSIIDSEFVI